MDQRYVQATMSNPLPNMSITDAVSLSHEFQEEAARRLGLLCLGLGIFAMGGLVMRRIAVASGMEVPRQFLPIIDGETVIIALVSVVIFVLSRTDRVSPTVLLRIGLFYEVGLCLAAALVERMLFDFGEPPVRLSFAVVFLLTFPVVVPTRPRVRVLTTVTAAAMVPLGGIMLAGAGKAIDDPGFYALAMAPTLMVAALGLLVWQIVYSLRRQVQEARQLGSYELVEKIGGGGMGEVWRARHRLLVRPAAVKLIRPDVLGGDAKTMLGRFEREAQATSALRSPHTVELYDFGITDDGTFYYAMELLEGFDLDTLVSRFGPQPPERVVSILKQACRSLADAHALGLIHRDIKPANIIVGRLGNEYDYVKVLDFGLVKAHQDASLGDAQLSRADSAVGTPAFMSPEAALAETIDPKADIYSLGCVAYWLLTGRQVFSGASPVQVMLEHVQSGPTAPSLRTEVEIPEDLERIVLECLKKKPQDRPESAEALYGALDRCSLRRPWSEESARQWWETHSPEGT
jgi:serine/threonine-protein kinase